MDGKRSWPAARNGALPLTQVEARDVLIAQACGAQDEIVHNPVSKAIGSGIRVVEQVFTTGVDPTVARARAVAIAMRVARRLLLVHVELGALGWVVVIVAVRNVVGGAVVRIKLEEPVLIKWVVHLIAHRCEPI